MSTNLLLYKPIKATYIPGDIDRMTDAEYEAAVADFFAEKTTHWPQIGYWKADNDKYKDETIYIMHVENYAEPRNRYGRKCVGKLLDSYRDYLVDSFDWMLPEDTRHMGKRSGRYAIPALLLMDISVKCKKEFYNHSNTIRYAFTREEAIRMVQDFVVGTEKNQYLEKIEAAWEDGMILELSF